MPALDRFRPASFRGIPFLVERVETSTGRRVVRHEISGGNASVGSNRTILEDLGLQPRVFSITALVSGEDGDLIASELQEALEQEGEGDLIHPWLGRRIVHVVGQASRSDSSRVAGMVEFSFELEEQTVERAIPTTLSYVDAVPRAAAETRAVAAADLEEQLATTGWPEYVRQATSAAVEQVGSVLQGLRFVQAQADKVSTFTQGVVDLINLASSLSTAPADLAVRILDSVERIRDSGIAASEAFYVYRTIFGTPSRSSGGASAAGLAADTNARLVVDLMRVAALYSAARAAAEAQWASGSESERARLDLNAELDDLQSRASDALFGALADLRVEIDRALPGTVNRTEDRREIVLPLAMPALALAYRYHGDAARADEIVAANAVAHPLFVPPGRPISVAIDG